MGPQVGIPYIASEERVKEGGERKTIQHYPDATILKKNERRKKQSLGIEYGGREISFIDNQWPLVWEGKKKGEALPEERS